MSAFTALLLGAAAAGAWAGPSELVAVGIVRAAPSVSLRAVGRFMVSEQKTGELKSLKSGQLYSVSAVQGALRFGALTMTGPVRLLPGRPGEHVVINDRKYKGNLLFSANADSTITVVDEIDIEDYLLGVLPKEMSPTWPIEALKAQAVVARTFALNNLGRFSEHGYDLTDDAFSQVYSGITDPSDRVSKAVADTRGLVLSYSGERLPVYFHSSCGGHTSDPGTVWGGGAKSPPPLKGVRDKYCRMSPHHRWSAYFRKDDLLRALSRRGIDAASLTGIRLSPKKDSGYAESVLLQLDRDWKSIPANTFRLWLGAAELKSARIEKIKSRSKGFEFIGSGYGHGVGLCQWGARAQADRGHDYETILAFYFPGARLAKEGARKK